MTNLEFQNQAELHKHFYTHCFSEAWKLCLEFSKKEEPFYLSYSHETLARLHGNTDLKNKQLQIAKELLVADLSNII